MTTTKFIPYVRQSIDASDKEAVAQALTGELITRGPIVEEFENTFAAYCEAKYAVAFNTGTAALMAAYHSAEVSVYDRLFTSPNTFVATVGGALNSQPTKGSPTPVFIDIDRNTGNINIDQLKLNLEAHEATRGRPIIAPIHFSGIAVDMRKLDQSIAHPDAIVIEDAAHAIGSHYPDGQKVGSCAWSHMTMFSFHPNKNITTGEGGMITTNDVELCRRLRLFRNNGIERDPHFLFGEAQPWYYEVQEITGNYNVTEMQAALGLSQLKRLDQFVAKRRKLVTHYRKVLEGKPYIRLFTADQDKLTAFHLFVIQVNFAAFKKTRSELMLKLLDRGIGTQVHYIPVYRHPFFRRGEEDFSSYFPEMEGYYSEALSLPLYYDLTTDDVDYICETLLDVLNR